jgi:hypothetical protein
MSINNQSKETNLTNEDINIYTNSNSNLSNNTNNNENLNVTPFESLSLLKTLNKEIKETDKETQKETQKIKFKIDEEKISDMKNLAKNFFNLCKGKLNTEKEKEKEKEKVKEKIVEKEKEKINQIMIIKEKTQIEIEQEIFNQLPQKIKYKKFKKFISVFQENLENKYINKLGKREKIDFNIKENSIKNFIGNFYFNNNKNKDINKNDIEILKEFSFSEFGFLRNEYRIKLYKILFMIEDNDNDNDTNININYINNNNIKQKSNTDKIFNKKISYLKFIENINDVNDNKKNKNNNIINIEKKFKEVYSLVENNNYNNNNLDNLNEELIFNKKNNLYYKSLISKWDNIKYESVIEVDIKRTILNKTLRENIEIKHTKETKENYKEKEIENYKEKEIENEIMLNFIKSQMTKKLKIFFSLFKEYNYYQGFHDIAIFIYLLITSTGKSKFKSNFKLNSQSTYSSSISNTYHNFNTQENKLKNPEVEVDGEKEEKKYEEEYENEEEENDDILLYEILQRLCEFYFKDYLTEFEYKITEGDQIINKKSFFSFENIHSIINKILKENDYNLFKLIEAKSDFPDPIYSLPWILTYFTHDINNLNMVYRIFDYLFMEHPLGIYFLSSNVK